MTTRGNVARARLAVSALVCAVVATVVVTTPAAASPSDRMFRIGAMTDVGVPDGATASLVVRPRRMLRLNAGVAHNSISPGVRTGLTFLPFDWPVTPVISLDVGHFFERDANKMVRVVLSDPTFSSPLLDRVGYDFADAHVGFEFGQRAVAFYVHAGVSAVYAQVHNASTEMVTFTSDPTVRIYSVSARMGLVFYLLP